MNGNLVTSYINFLEHYALKCGRVHADREKFMMSMLEGVLIEVFSSGDTAQFSDLLIKNADGEIGLNEDHYVELLENIEKEDSEIGEKFETAIKKAGEYLLSNSEFLPKEKHKELEFIYRQRILSQIK